MTASGVALICVFLQVALTFWAVARMGWKRAAALKAGETSLGRVAIDSKAYPEKVVAFGNNAQNQFETPVLLYAVVALGIALQAMSWGLAFGAVVYTAARFLHRAIHLGNNNVIVRFNVFLAGLVGVFVAWVALAVTLLGI